jgi:hypothetical protein
MSSALVEMYQIPVEPSSPTRRPSDTFRHLLDMKGIVEAARVFASRPLSRAFRCLFAGCWQVSHPPLRLCRVDSKIYAFIFVDERKRLSK